MIGSLYDKRLQTGYLFLYFNSGVSRMACRNLSTTLTPFHWPTLLLVIGYPVYWLELYFFRIQGGHTSLFASGLFLLLIGVLAFDYIRSGEARKVLASFITVFGVEPWWFVLCSVAGALVILFVAGHASLLPPHLPQEFDVINYHVTIPRQHLITGSFRHLSWSAADLFLAPLSHALSPYWLISQLPNKFPQFLFFLALPFVCARLACRFSGFSCVSGFLAGTFVTGMHAIGIQAGTAMLDIAITYLFFAAVDSYQQGNYAIAGIEFSFFIWSKPLMPVFFGIVMVVYLLAVLALRQFRGLGTALKPVFWASFLLTGVLIAGPFLWRSWLVAGTPVYPLTVTAMTGNCSTPVELSALDRTACRWVAMKDEYGHGRSWGDFLRHFWLISVPEKGVNNSFDYPVGFMYLLLLGPFLLFVFGRNGLISSSWWLALFCVVYWGCWWFGSQQSRFLLIPLTGMAIVVAATFRSPGRSFRMAVILALGLTALSVVRAHQADWGRSAYDVLRPEDRNLLTRAREILPGMVLSVDRPDVAFAPVRVTVSSRESPFVVD